jgi:hypothetical protein
MYVFLFQNSNPFGKCPWFLACTCAKGLLGREKTVPYWLVALHRCWVLPRGYPNSGAETLAGCWDHMDFSELLRPQPHARVVGVNGLARPGRPGVLSSKVVLDIEPMLIKMTRPGQSQCPSPPGGLSRDLCMDFQFLLEMLLPTGRQTSKAGGQYNHSHDGT